MSAAVFTSTVLPAAVNHTRVDDCTGDRLQPEQQGSELLLFADIFQQLTPLQSITSDSEQPLTISSIFTATPLIDPAAEQSVIKIPGTAGNILPTAIAGGTLLPPSPTIPLTTAQETTTPATLQTPTDNNSPIALDSRKAHQALEAATTPALPATQITPESWPLQIETVKPVILTDQRLAFLTNQKLLNQITTSAAMVNMQEKAGVTTQQRAGQIFVPEINRFFSGTQTNTGSSTSEVAISITNYIRNLQMAQSILGYSNDSPGNEEAYVLEGSTESVDLQALTLTGQNTLLQNHTAVTPQLFHTAALPATPIAGDTSGRPVFEISLTQSDWEQHLGEKLMWMGDKQIQSASIRLNPPELGPIDIDLNIKKDQININFITQGAHAKEALDFAIPKLREMFLESGFNTVNVDVSSQEHGRYQQHRYHDDTAKYSASTPTFQHDPVELTEILRIDSPAAEGKIRNHIDLYT